MRGPGGYGSRKFLLASLFALAGCYAFLFTDKLSGGEFVGLALGLVGCFNLSDTALNYIHNRQKAET